MVIQAMIETKLGSRLWTNQDRIDNGVFSLTLSNANGLDIVDILTACIYCIYLPYLLYIVFYISYAFILDKNGKYSDNLFVFNK